MSQAPKSQPSAVLERVYGATAVIHLIDLLERYATTPAGVKLVSRSTLINAFTDDTQRSVLETCLAVDGNQPPSQSLVVHNLHRRCTQQEVARCIKLYAHNHSTTARPSCRGAPGPSAQGRRPTPPHTGLPSGMPDTHTLPTPHLHPAPHDKRPPSRTRLPTRRVLLPQQQRARPQRPLVVYAAQHRGRCGHATTAALCLGVLAPGQRVLPAAHWAPRVPGTLDDECLHTPFQRQPSFGCHRCGCRTMQHSSALPFKPCCQS